MDSNSSDDEDFEGFVISPEEKSSYKVWTRKRRASGRLSDNNLSEDDEEEGDEDEDSQSDEDDDEDEDGDGNEFAEDGGENEELDDPMDDINIQDSSDEMSSSNTDQCPVCLMSLKEQLLGTPNNCPHVFCFECIQEWAKNATTCPVGRKPFSEILVQATKKGPILQRIPVEERQAGDDEDEEDDPTYCEVCGECNREDRMLLCDGCDNGYHMECLTPPVEFVPLDEWLCPACSSHHQERGEEAEEERGDNQVMEVPRARTTRGRPRGGTARRGSGRTATTRTARTVASTRRRGTTRTGRGRGRSSSRGRGGRSSSTRGRSSSTRTKTKKKRRKKRRHRSTKKTGSSGRKQQRMTSKTKTLKLTKKRRIAEEEEVSPFIYEPQRRGKTVHARLLESLNAPGPSIEPSRSTSIGRMPFPSRVEPSCSFSLFGNAYALHDFDQQQDVQGTTQEEDQTTTAWSSESSNPDLLGSIFQGLNTLHSSSSQLSRDGKMVTITDQSRVEGSEPNSKSSKDTATISKDENMPKSEVQMNEGIRLEKKPLRENIIVSKEPEDAKMPSKDNRDSDAECTVGTTFEDCSKAPEEFAVSSRNPEKASRSQQSSSTSIKNSPLPLSKAMSSKSTLSEFRIPKRSSSLDSQSKPTLGISSASVKREQVLDSNISKFKIPKLIKSSNDDTSKRESSSVNLKHSNAKGIEQRLGTSSTGSEEQKKNCGTITARSSFSSINSIRPVKQENLQKQNFRNSSTADKPGRNESGSVSRCHANKLSRIPRSDTTIPSTASVAAGSCVTNSRDVTSCQAQKSVSSCHAIDTKNSSSTSANALNVTNVTTCHATKFGDTLQSRSAVSSHFPSLTKVCPSIDGLKPVRGKEQRRSNIEILKMLQEKQRSMREQMADDRKAPSESLLSRSAEIHSRLLPREGLNNMDKSPSCPREAKLPVAIVRPSPQYLGPAMATASVPPSSSSESSPIKSIASGIIDAHSSNTHEFKRVDPGSTIHSKDKVTVRKQDEKVAGTNGDRDQQRKLGIARLQRNQQIVDEVKLALKPFYRRGEITKDDYKLIMKKSVEKIKESSSSVDRDRVGRLVKKYIQKVKGGS